MAAGGFGLREHCVRPSRAKAGEISSASSAARSAHKETSDSLGDCRAARGRMVRHGRDFSGVGALSTDQRHRWRQEIQPLENQVHEEVKVVQEPLRQANSRITLDLYTQAGMPNKRLAESKLVRMVSNRGEALGLNWAMTQIANSLQVLEGMARTTRLELATSALTGQQPRS